MRQTFCLTFRCREQKTNRQGLAPIEAIIIINGERTIITLARKERPADFEKQVKAKRSNDIQEYLEEVRVKVNQIQTQLLKDGERVNPANIKEYYKTGGKKAYTVQMLFDEYTSILSKRVAAGELLDRNYIRYRNAAETFITMTGITPDRPLKDLTPYHIEVFKAELKAKYKDSTAQSYMKKIRTMIDYAFKTGKVNQDCFCGVKLPHPEPKREYLSDENIERLKTKEITIERLSKVRDLFIFQMNCGLSYGDLAGVKELLYKDGIYYIKGRRIKTGIEFTTVVLDDGVEIWNRYGGSLPIISNQRCNSYLKELGDICGIEQTLTTHLFRKTFATKMLNKGVSISNVSKMLGHSNTTITEKHYAIVKDDAILDDVRDKMKTTPN